MDGSPGVEGQPGAEGQDFLVDENSQSSLGSFSTKKKKQWGDVGGNEMAGIHNPLANVTAETLFEYKWPLEGRSSEHFFLQEQVGYWMDSCQIYLHFIFYQHLFRNLYIIDYLHW